MSDPGDEMSDTISAADYVAMTKRTPAKHNTEPEEKTDLADWLAATFGSLLRAEYPYVPGRKFRADWAVPRYKLLIEYAGIMRGTVGHNSVGGILIDHERANAAALHGWVTFTANAKNVADGTIFTTINDWLDINDDRAFAGRHTQEEPR